jgi:hypothetical protein
MLAVAALAAAPLSATIPAAASSLPTDRTEFRLAQARAAVANPAEDRADKVEQRIANLHAQLNITPEQEPLWTGVAEAMRGNIADMEKLIGERRQSTPEHSTAIDDLNAHQALAEAHLDGLKRLNAAFKVLYDAMPEAQRRNADKVFENLHKAGLSPG